MRRGAKFAPLFLSIPLGFIKKHPFIPLGFIKKYPFIPLGFIKK